jgi:hypothetical protein
MPITGPASYVPTTLLFLDHWEDANAELGVTNPLLVGQANPAGGSPIMKSRADLVTLKDALVAARDLVTAETVGLSLKREQTRDDMAALLARFNQFASAVRSRYAGKAFERSLPNAPSVGDAADVFAKAIKKAETLWIAINSCKSLRLSMSVFSVCSLAVAASAFARSAVSAAVKFPTG